jgi:hypothetical protein
MDLYRLGLTRAPTDQGGAILARSLGPKPLWGQTRQGVAHHDFPQELEDWFAMKGIDINAGVDSGRWLPADFHHVINGKGLSGYDGNAFNYQWKEFRRISDVNGAASIADIEAFRDELRAITNNHDAKSIAWKYMPPLQ